MIAWDGELDPAETLDFEMDFANGAEPVLAAGEAISTFSLAATAAAAAYGLQIKTGGGYSPGMDVLGQTITLWLEVDVAEQSNPDFADGVILGIEATIVTDSSPARTRQRTFLVTVKQL